MRKTTICLICVASIAGYAQAEMICDFEASGFTVGNTVDNHLPDGTLAVPPVDYTNWTPPAWATVGSRRNGYTADEEIVDIGGSHGKVWRYSPGGEDGLLGQTPKSPHDGFVAGETGALNDAGMGAPTTNVFYGQFDFRSVTMAAQTDMAIRACAASMDQRHGYVRILDSGAGLDVGFWNAPLGVYDTVTTGLSYTDWHTLGINVIFNDGLDNDVVDVYVNGGLLYTGPSWESYYTGYAESVDRLSFDTYLNTSFLGGGLYIDNVLIDDIVVPIPGAVLLGILGLGAAGFKLRKSA